MRAPTRRDLRAVRYRKQLPTVRQPRQPLPNRTGHRTANSAIDLVEDYRRGPAPALPAQPSKPDEAR